MDTLGQRLTSLLGLVPGSTPIENAPLAYAMQGMAEPTHQGAEWGPRARELIYGPTAMTETHLAQEHAYRALLDADPAMRMARGEDWADVTPGVSQAMVLVGLAGGAFAPQSSRDRPARGVSPAAEIARAEAAFRRVGTKPEYESVTLSPHDLEIYPPHADRRFSGRNPLGSAGILSRGEIHGWHVTSNPKRVLETLQSGTSVMGGRDEEKWGDLGRGLYMSAAPSVWTGRAPDKWDFLPRLTEVQRRILHDALRERVEQESPFLSRTEKEYATRGLADYLEHGDDWGVVNLANQPYRIPAWRPDFLETLGIMPGTQPDVVPMSVRGRFLGVDYMNHYELPDALRSLGFQGMYAPSGWSNAPQLVVWDNDAISRFGPYRAAKVSRQQFPAYQKYEKASIR